MAKDPPHRGDVVELSDSAALRCKARYGRVVQLDIDSIFVNVRPETPPFFVALKDVKARYTPA